jgi:hypothetical protein
LQALLGAHPILHISRIKVKVPKVPASPVASRIRKPHKSTEYQTLSGSRFGLNSFLLKEGSILRDLAIPSLIIIEGTELARYGDIWVSVPLVQTENEYSIYNISGSHICAFLASILYQVLTPCRCRLYW